MKSLTGMVWYVATQTDIAWPWFCLIGATVNIVVSISASLIIDGRQATYSPYTVKGQIAKFRAEGKAEKDRGAASLSFLILALLFELRDPAAPVTPKSFLGLSIH